MEHTSSKNFILWIVLFLVVIISGVGFSFALFTYVRTSKEGYNINSSSIKLGFFENTDGISLTNALPVDDNTALSSSSPENYFDFYVSYGVNDAVLNYEIDIENISNQLSDDTYSVLDSTYVKIALFNRDTSTFVVSPKYFNEIENVPASNSKNGYKLYSSSVTSSTSSDNYRLFLWISDVDYYGNNVSPLFVDDNSIANKVFSVKLNLQAVANVE